MHVQGTTFNKAGSSSEGINFLFCCTTNFDQAVMHIRKSKFPTWGPVLSGALYVQVPDASNQVQGCTGVLRDANLHYRCHAQLYIATCSGNYRARQKGGLQVAQMLQAKPGRSGKQQQEQISPYQVPTFSQSLYHMT